MSSETGWDLWFLRRKGRRQKHSSSSTSGDDHRLTEEQNQRAKDIISLLQNACDVASKQYDDYYKSFAALDAKAQGTATVSGLVLAAMAAFLKDGRIPVIAKSGVRGFILILLPPTFALLAVVVSLWAARIMDIVEPFGSTQRTRDAINLSKQDPDLMSNEQVFIYYREQLKDWEKTFDGDGKTTGIVEAVNNKGILVHWGQILMVSSLCLLLILFVEVLIKSGTP